MEVAKRCEQGTWPELTKLLQDKGVTDVELGKACQALCRFIATQADDPKERMAAGLSRCGFLDLDPHARIAVMAYLGTYMLGLNWTGVREATLGGIGPTQHYQALRWHGLRCVKLMTIPRWRRRLYNFWGRVRKAWRVFWQTKLYED